MIQVKGRPEVPGKPGKPSVDEQNVDSLRLSWLAPTEDGGSPISQYIVEMHTVGTDLCSSLKAFLVFKGQFFYF